MVLCGIYKIQNKINNKIYIGQSINIFQRWNSHKRAYKDILNKDYNKHLYRSIRKYGIENFDFSVIEECSREELNEKEKYWISYYDSTNPEKGYNLLEGGNNVPHYVKLSKEQICNIQKELIFSNKTQQDIAINFDVTQQMISEINLGKAWKDDNLDYPLRKIKKKIIICQNCGKELFEENVSGLCKNCYSEIHRKVKDRPTREKLKEEIRFNSFLSLGKKYGVSDNAIRRWCKSYNLPYKATEIKKYSDKEWENI